MTTESPERRQLDEFDPRELYPTLQRAMHAEGWDDPSMDEYNLFDLDESFPTPSFDENCIPP